jgi:hypothetical protein
MFSGNLGDISINVSPDKLERFHQSLINAEKYRHNRLVHSAWELWCLEPTYVRFDRLFCQRDDPALKFISLLVLLDLFSVEDFRDFEISIRRLAATAYSSYLKTFYWVAIRDYIVYQRRNMCQKCCSNRRLEVHHTTYSIIGIEYKEMHKLQLLCEKCHHEVHNLPYIYPQYEVSKRKFPKHISKIILEMEILEMDNFSHIYDTKFT